MKPRLVYTWLVCRAFFELARYDVVYAVCGFRRIQRQLDVRPVRAIAAPRDLERTICDAVLLALCFYWKPVLCLQHSVCATRLLRAHGIDAHVRIGYRPAPFFSHAWVEVDGRVVNDSPAYRRLQSLPLSVSPVTAGSEAGTRCAVPMAGGAWERMR